MSLLSSLVIFFGTNFEGAWNVANKSPTIRRWLSKKAINNAINNGPRRPDPLSQLTDFTSWESLTDRSYSGRHLPPVSRSPGDLPDIDDVVELFAYRGDEWKRSEKSTLLFSYFAQWFTDGFLRTDRTDRRRNTSNHDIDLSPLYGLNKDQTEVLRSKNSGRLESQTINGGEYPPYLYDNGEVKDKYKILKMILPRVPKQGQLENLFAMGGDRANIQIGYVMMNVMFLREHNRVCGELEKSHADWDDERLFQTARNVIIAQVLKLVIEEYIDHISRFHFKLIIDPLAFTEEPWRRQNWMTVEFNLLYRWHSLTPPEIVCDGKSTAMRETMFRNQLITSRGLGSLMDESTRQPCGEIGLHNTMPLLVSKAERASIEQGRDADLASYNDYREMCKLPRVTDFAQITRDASLQKELKALYGDVDKVEFYVGLFAEDTIRNSVLSELLGRLVAFDAFSQALNNPLLSKRVYNTNTFSRIGMEIINDTNSLSDIVHRNVPDTGKRYKVSMTRLDRNASA